MVPFLGLNGVGEPEKIFAFHPLSEIETVQCCPLSLPSPPPSRVCVFVVRTLGVRLSPRLLASVAVKVFSVSRSSRRVSEASVELANVFVLQSLARDSILTLGKRPRAFLKNVPKCFN